MTIDHLGKFLIGPESEPLVFLQQQKRPGLTSERSRS